MPCSPTSPTVGMSCVYGHLVGGDVLVKSATVTRIVSGTTVDLNVSGVGTRTNVQHSNYVSPNRWGCPGEPAPPNQANWSSGSDARLKEPA